MTVGEGMGQANKDVSLRDLRVFVAVAEHLHFTRAAEALYLSQPALSKQVRALERWLGVELFARNRRQVRLTPTGEALMPGAQATLAAWATAQDALAAVQAQEGVVLHVGISLGVERGLLPRIHHHLVRDAPDVTLRLRRVSWSDPSSGLARDAEPGVDAAFVWLPLPHAVRYRWVSVASEIRWLVMPAQHRLATRPQVAFTEVMDEPFLALPSSAGPARDFWLGADARGDRPARVSGYASSTEELIEALIAGVGICLIAEGNLEAFRREDIATVRVTGLPPSTLVLAWRRGDDRPILRQLVAATTKAVNQPTVGRPMTQSDVNVGLRPQPPPSADSRSGT
ncbi:LysR family transcriptional regulator [Jatrophihabitans lederbergiae]|uniref:LysR family transcriptional regulator n=1 Tax=Jatrophihabitans lederbergiae TaxID=3075547 RepID=A0ABU2JF27_9ACTN|nr:LysR family transcriptional regulator [Jatrophihabitans sp. DSM 44399]MDT0263598.1 LysR family transcriptional regulator [Jatrophihabitans sp. DSM 44399]